jgi:predicted ribosome quality control (RQC) complex YloA/Tae2 family protein
MVTQLSSSDIHFLVKEFQFLVGSKIEKVFQSENKNDLLIIFHSPNRGKVYLFYSFPSTICLTDFKPEFPSVPPNFCASLRRKITNARIQNITQEGFERIINFDLTTKNGESKLVFETFSNGNVILYEILKESETSNKILAVAKSEVWGTRILKVGQEYKYPPKQINPYELSQKQIFEIILKSEKESLVKSLAMDLSIGGIYAEEILFNQKIDKNLKPNTITQKQSTQIYDELKKIYDLELSARICDDKPYPIKLNHLTFKNETLCDSFSQAISQLELKNQEKQILITENKEKKENLTKIDKVILSQSKQLESLKKSMEENNKKGELIYQNYLEVQKILKFIQDNKKKEWSFIKEKLKESSLFVSLDENNGKLTLDLN